MVSSATPRALAPSALHTLMFNFLAASKSMLSRPLPLRLITRRDRADSRTFAVTGSTPARKPTQSDNNCVSSPSVGNLPAGDKTTVYPARSSLDKDTCPFCVTDLGVTSIVFVLTLHHTQSASALRFYCYLILSFVLTLWEIPRSRYLCSSDRHSQGSRKLSSPGFSLAKPLPLSDASGDSRQLIKYQARCWNVNMKNLGNHARPPMKKINPPIFDREVSSFTLCTRLI